MVYVPVPKLEYDPFNLPKAIDFHLATKDLDLPRETKSKIQIAISKMDRAKIKQLIKDLDEMRWDAMSRHDYKMQAYCRSIKEFVEKYFYSMDKQKKV
jgi:hypothetical protein